MKTNRSFLKVIFLLISFESLVGQTAFSNQTTYNKTISNDELTISGNPSFNVTPGSSSVSSSSSYYLKLGDPALGYRDIIVTMDTTSSTLPQGTKLLLEVKNLINAQKAYQKWIEFGYNLNPIAGLVGLIDPLESFSSGDLVFTFSAESTAAPITNGQVVLVYTVRSYFDIN